MMAREAGSCPKCGKPYYEDTRKDNERIYTCECNKGERTVDVTLDDSASAPMPKDSKPLLG